jgi:hypothetical protein
LPKVVATLDKTELKVAAAETLRDQVSASPLPACILAAIVTTCSTGLVPELS